MSDAPRMTELDPLSRVVTMCREERHALNRIEDLAFKAHAASYGDSANEHREALRKVRSALHGHMAAVKVTFDLANRLESAASRRLRQEALAEREALTVAHLAGNPIIDQQTTEPVVPNVDGAAPHTESPAGAGEVVVASLRETAHPTIAEVLERCFCVAPGSIATLPQEAAE